MNVIGFAGQSFNLMIDVDPAPSSVGSNFAFYDAISAQLTTSSFGTVPFIPGTFRVYDSIVLSSTATDRIALERSIPSEFFRIRGGADLLSFALYFPTSTFSGMAPPLVQTADLRADTIPLTLDEETDTVLGMGPANLRYIQNDDGNGVLYDIEHASMQSHYAA